ncbi:MAG: Cysteine desulfurase IscS [Chlamydiae bacterium]|nr:Cysteine desulfurase IscS [Chlamydiota bacterium]
MRKIYLDNNATTEIDPRVQEALIEEMKRGFGNPSSIHSFGQEVRNRLTKARRTITSFFGIKPTEFLFTSSGTEAINMVFKGTEGHILTSSAEHACVYANAKEMEERGRSVDFLSPGEHGAVTVDQVRESIRPNTGLIALMAVNNETGVKTDIDAIAVLAEEHKIPFFVDAVALVGKELFTVPSGVSGFCISGHKFHAPKGIGGLFLRSPLKPLPLITGGPQEYNKRAGTENVIGIIGMAKAIEVLEQELPEATERMGRLRDYLEQEIISRVSDVLVNGEGPRVCNTNNLSFVGVEGESILMNCDMAGLALSHGSACSSGSLEPSRILMSMGLTKDRARSSIRFSLSRFTTEEEIERAIEIVVNVVNQLRSI